MMDSKKSLLGSIEDRLVRIPELVRKDLGITTGIFLCFRGIKGDDVYLQVAPAYYDDAVRLRDNDKVIYVNTDTLRMLDVKKIDAIKPFNDILIGCDPEFFLTEKGVGRNISASNFFSHYGEVGSDGGLVEIRPRPDFKPKGVVSNIYELFNQVYHRIQTRGILKRLEIEMVAASNHRDASAGFHIHFGLPETLLRRKLQTAWIMSNMVNILDFYVGIPAILPEGNEDCKRRSERFSRYGKPGDHRVDSLTLEYRVPGGHLLRHPVLTWGILAIGTTVMKDLLSRLNTYTEDFKRKVYFDKYEDLKTLYPHLPSKESVYNAVTSENTVLALGYIDTILADLSLMIGFEENATAIMDYFNYVVDFYKGIRRFNERIEANWRLGNERQQGSMAVLQASV